MTKKILICDDEPDNVAPLRALLDSKGIETILVETIPEALEEVKKTSYDAIICDNDLYIQEPGPTDDWYGIDFINCLIGKSNTNFGKKFFGKNYNKIQNRYASNSIIFSGSAKRLIKEAPEKFENIPVCIKYPDQNNNYCEEQVLSELENIGFDVANGLEAIIDYKQGNNISNGTKSHEDQVAEFFKSLGLEKELENYN